MKHTACIELERRHERPLFIISEVVTLVAIFTFLAATPLHADTIYSGASVGSDGTVYGWGVTDATSMAVHTTHMNSTLSSPQGRQTSGFTSGGDYSRIDLSLSFDPNDTGTYQMSSTHWAYCPYGGWFINGLQTQGSASNAYPTNFTQTGAQPFTNGELYFTYTWASSSGKLSDLGGCLMFEIVTYPAPPPTYDWPPPWNVQTLNPLSYPPEGVNGSKGGLDDTQNTGTFAPPPYTTNEFHAIQSYSYYCPGFGGNLATGIDIDRKVTNNGTVYTYIITKSGSSASCQLGVNCENQ